MSLLRLSALVLATCLVAASLQNPDASVSLSRAYKKGQMTRYEAATTLKAAGGEAVQTSKLRIEVSELKADGVVVLVTHFDGGHVKSPLGEQDIPGGVDITETRDRRGRLQAWKRSDTADAVIADEIRQLMGAVSNAILPDKPVKIGDSWKIEADNPAAKGKKIAYMTTYVGMESLDGGQQLWKLKQSASADIEATSSKLTTELVEWVDPVTGATIKADATLAGVPTQFGELTLSSHLTAVKDEKKGK